MTIVKIKAISLEAMDMFTEDQPCPKNLDHDQLCLLATEYCFQTLWPHMQDYCGNYHSASRFGVQTFGCVLCAT